MIVVDIITRVNDFRFNLGILLFAERKAHPPLGAWAEGSHGVRVVVTGKLGNRTAPSGWMVRLVRFGFL
jgi:hypothetical protein